MQFPGFSRDHFMPQFHSHGTRGGCSSRAGAPSGRCGGCTSRPGSSARPSPFSSWPAAAFIPVTMMGPRPRNRQEADGQHTCGSTPRQMPSFCQGESCMSQPAFEEAFNMAQGLLGELFGQPSSPAPDAQRRGQSANKQPSTQHSAEGNCSKKTPAKSCPKTPSDTAAQKPSSQEKRAKSEPSVTQSSQKTKDQPAAGKSLSSHHQEATPSDLLWSHSLYFSGLAPSKVSVKAKDGQVLVRAFHEKSCGPSTHLSKLDVTRTVKLPENVDHKTLTCLMKKDGTLVLQAHFKDNHTEKEADETDRLADQAEKPSIPERNEGEMDGSETKSEAKSLEKTEISTDQKETVTFAAEKKSERQGLQNKSEKVKGLETRADGRKALEDRSDSMHALESKAGDLQALENQTEAGYTEVQNNLGVMEKPDGGEFQHSAERNEGCTGDMNDAVVAEEQYQHSGDEAQVTDKNWSHPTSFPLIEEPEVESFSSGEEIPQPSSMTMEDFVVVDEDSISIEKTEDGNNDGMNNTDIQTPEDLVPQDQAQTEEAVTEQTHREIGPSNETDPTRPIKRTVSQDPVHDSSENVGTPYEHSGPYSGPLATDPGHSGAFRASLPLVGFSPGDVHVKLYGHTLRITAKRQSWLGDAPYMENVERELELPGHLNMLTVKCLYQQDHGCLTITAEPVSQQRQVPVQVQ